MRILITITVALLVIGAIGSIFLGGQAVEGHAAAMRHIEGTAPPCPTVMPTP